jgi:hypothetical protein
MCYKIIEHICNYSGTIRNLNIGHTFQSEENVLTIFESSIDHRTNPGKLFSAFFLSITKLT